jgi:hypothetical protein
VAGVDWWSGGDETEKRKMGAEAAIEWGFFGLGLTLM